MNNKTRTEQEVLDLVFAGIEEARDAGRRVFDMWREARPLLPIPGMLRAPDGNGSIAVTPTGYQALSDWCYLVWCSETAMAEAITLEEWTRYVFDSFLRVCISASASASETDECEGAIHSAVREILVAGAIDALSIQRFFIYPLVYAREPLTERMELGPLVFVPPTDVLAEIESAYQNISEESVYATRNETLAAIEKYANRVTCFVKVVVVGLGSARADQWACAVARLGLVAILMPYGAPSVANVKFADEVLGKQGVHFRYRADVPCAPGLSWDMPHLKAADVINDQTPEYVFFKEGLARLLSTYISTSKARADTWRCYRLGEMWLSAVHWFHRGVTAELDSEAVIALGTCLNVLVNGLGRGKMIAAIARILKTGDDAIVLQRPEPVTLRELIKELYSQGRSRVIHGTRDAIKDDYSLLRKRGESLAGSALLGYWYELARHEGHGGKDDFDDFLVNL